MKNGSMLVKKTKGEQIFSVVNYILLVFLIVIMLYPCLNVVFSSLSDSNQLMMHSGFLFAPIGFTLDAYKEVFQNRLIGTGYINTIINLILALFFNMTLTILGAYPLSRKDLKLRRPIMLGITFTMFFSGGLIPTYILVRSLGMSNTRWALFIPTAISAYNLIILRTSFEAIPESLIESAKLDGASEYKILTHIVIPVSMASISVIVLFYAVSQWNAWFPAFIYLKERGLWPLQLVLREIVISNNLDEMLVGADTLDRAAIAESIKYATIVVATAPILIIYPFLQKYFVKGVMIGAIKG